jgi:phytoene synthase
MLTQQVKSFSTNKMTLEESYKHCRKINAKFGKSYFFATKLFPREIQNSVFALYAFFRIPDEIVDNPDGDDTLLQMETKLKNWDERWKQAYERQFSDDPVLYATAITFKKHSIPFEYSKDFLASMKQDLFIKRYKTYANLEEYMYGSAGVVGLMMTHIIGYTDNKAFDYAKILGNAMQMTNFLRDICEDFQKRDRIYVPLEDLERFGVTEDALKAGRVDENFRALMEFEIDRTRRLYQEAEKGIKYLAPRGKGPVKVALKLYREILVKIEKNGYDVFTYRAKTGFWEKVKLALLL